MGVGVGMMAVGVGLIGVEVGGIVGVGVAGFGVGFPAASTGDVAIVKINKTPSNIKRMGKILFISIAFSSARDRMVAYVPVSIYKNGCLYVSDNHHIYLTNRTIYISKKESDYVISSYPPIHTAKKKMHPTEICGMHLVYTYSVNFA